MTDHLELTEQAVTLNKFKYFSFNTFIVHLLFTITFEFCVVLVSSLVLLCLPLSAEACWHKTKEKIELFTLLVYYY